MAQTILCDSEDGNAADILISQIANGDTIALCGGCLPIWALGMIEAMTPPEPEPSKPRTRKGKVVAVRDDDPPGEIIDGGLVQAVEAPDLDMVEIAGTDVAAS